MKKQILVVGEIKGSYRTQYLLQSLFARNIADDHLFYVTLTSHTFFLLHDKLRLLYKRPLYWIGSSLASFLTILELLIKIPFSDAIFLVAMNHEAMPYIHFCNFFWRKPVICDMLISLYDSTIDRAVDNRGLSPYYSSKQSMYLDRLVIENSDILIYVSKAEFDLICETVKVRKRPRIISIIPSTSSRREKVIHQTIPSPLRLCWWGSLTPFHGIDTLVDALQHLRTSQSHYTLHLFVRPGTNTDPLRERIESCGLTTQISIHTDKTFGNGRLEDWLRTNCDLALGNFYFSSRSDRALPTKVIDSLSLGLPVLTLDTAMIREFFEPGKNILTCGKSPKDVALSLDLIFENPCIISQIALEGYSLYNKCFAPEVVMKKFRDLLIESI
jgi:glycosyltransferase involved in cell wall biosynthesis